MFDFDVAVIIPMAGSSQRFPSSTPKQYFDVMGKPLFLFCVEEFYKLPYIKKICLVCDRVELVQDIIEEKFMRQEKILVVKGGLSRHISIKIGLTELVKSENFYKVVVVHDGVRPLVPEQLLVKVISGAAAHGAAGATRPLVSTVVKPMSDGCLETSLDRSEYLLSETPQAFLVQLIMNAYQKCSPEDLEKGTECLQLALKYCGVRAKLIPGPESLWKVTDKKDFYSIVPYVREISTDVCLLGQEDSEVIQGLKESLKNRVNRVECLETESHGKPSQQLFNTVVCLHDKEMDQENQMLKFASVLDVDHQDPPNSFRDARTAVFEMAQGVEKVREGYREFSRESQGGLSSLMEKRHPKGLIIHVVEHSSSDGMQSTSIYELHRTGRNMTKQYEKLKKGVVMIHYLSHGEEKRLVDLIVSLIFTDAQTISGQTLFL